MRAFLPKTFKKQQEEKIMKQQARKGYNDNKQGKGIMTTSRECK